MNKIVFTNEKEKIALSLSVRKQVIKEILEDCRCRNCKAFMNYLHKNKTSIEDV